MLHSLPFRDPTWGCRNSRDLWGTLQSEQLSQDRDCVEHQERYRDYLGQSELQAQLQAQRQRQRQLLSADNLNISATNPPVSRPPLKTCHAVQKRLGICPTDTDKATRHSIKDDT